MSLAIRHASTTVPHIYVLSRDSASLQEVRKSHRHQGLGRLLSSPGVGGLVEFESHGAGIHLGTVLGQG